MNTDHDLTETRLSTETLADGFLLKAWRDTVRLPDGTTGIREYIRHPGAVVMVPLFPNGDTLLIQQFRYAAEKSFIELPAGKLDGQEPLEEAVQRELAEETGFACGRMIPLTDFYPCIGYSNERMWLYLAIDLEPAEAKTDDDEFIILSRLPFQEAVQMVFRGEIDDMKTMLGLLIAERYLKNHPVF
jgi:ADP-ribose pyrophosphatase